MVVLVCGISAIILPIAFSVGIAGLLGCLLLIAAIAHFIFGLHFGRGAFGWHAFLAGMYAVAGLNLLVNPLLGVVLLALLVGLVLVAEGIIEIALFFALRDYRYAIWILLDGLITLGLGIVACRHWPPEAPEMIQYLVGLSMISSGLSRLVLGFAIRVVDPTATATG